MPMLIVYTYVYNILAWAVVYCRGCRSGNTCVTNNSGSSTLFCVMKLLILITLVSAATSSIK